MLESQTRNRLRAIALLLLGPAALFSLVRGIHHAFQYESHDLQWISAHLIDQHIDPWQEKLSGLPHHPQHFSPPNYLHVLYLILLPFGLLDFHTAEVVWCIASVCFSVGVVYLLKRLFSLDYFQSVLILCLLWMSSPFRVVLETGQMSLCELFLFSAAYAIGFTWLGAISFGVSFAKYSFSPVAVLVHLLRGRIRFLLIAIGVALIGLLGIHLLLPTPLSLLAREPLIIARTSVNPGFADVMTYAEYFFRQHFALARAISYSYLISLAGTVAYAIFVSRYRLSRGAELTLVSLASLLLFKHLIYDYVFLLVPLAYALGGKNPEKKRPIIAIVLIFWFLAALLGRSVGDYTVNLAGMAINVLLLAALLAYTTYAVIREESQEALAVIKPKN
jgi:hypothetical protein